VRFRFAVWLWAAAVLGQEFSGIELEKFAWGFNYTEGPVWSAQDGLIFSDVPMNLVYRVKAGAAPAVLRRDSGGTMGEAMDARGRLYMCETAGRRVVRMDKNGKIEVLAERWEGKRLNAPNDIVVRRDGNAWFTDPAFGSAQQTRELDFYGVFHISPAGRLDVIAKPKGRPNGVALSPDGKTLYVTNSDERNVRAYRLDRKNDAAGETVVVSFVEGVPDGICTDEQGNLYVAARKLFIYSPKGQLLWAVPFEETPTNCAFGDADMKSLFVTTRTSVYRLRVPVKGWSVDERQ
jgi:gluconolactonase